MTNSDDNHRKKRAAKDWRLGKELSEDMRSYSVFGLGKRVAYMLSANYRTYSQYGCDEDLAFKYSVMDDLAVLANFENLMSLRKIAGKYSRKKIKEDLHRSEIIKELLADRKRRRLTSGPA